MAAERRSVATTLEAVGPGTSARMACMRREDLKSSDGMMARTKTRTPMPPIQCVRARQSAMPRSRSAGNVPTSPPRMVAPVVVKPETVSKKASTGLWSAPHRRNGSMPNSDTTTHDSPTANSPARASIRSRWVGGRNVSAVPPSRSRAIGMASASAEPSP